MPRVTTLRGDRRIGGSKRDFDPGSEQKFFHKIVDWLVNLTQSHRVVRNWIEKRYQAHSFGTEDARNVSAADPY